MAMFIKLFDYSLEGSDESIMLMDKWIHQVELGKRLRIIRFIQDL